MKGARPAVLDIVLDGEAGGGGQRGVILHQDGRQRSPQDVSEFAGNGAA